MAELEEKQRKKLFSELSLLEEDYDIMLVDTGAGLNENVLSFVLPSDEVIIITTPESTAITDAYSMIKVIIQHKRDIKINLLVNMASSQEEAEEVIKRMTEVVKRFLNFKIDYLGYILKDKNVPNAVKIQQPFVRSYPYTSATRCLKDIAARINIESFGGGSFEIKEGRVSRIKGFFRRMSGIFYK
jgi:flagellar biosynthesis protein FlhG